MWARRQQASTLASCVVLLIVVGVLTTTTAYQQQLTRTTTSSRPSFVTPVGTRAARTTLRTTQQDLNRRIPSCQLWSSHHGYGDDKNKKKKNDIEEIGRDETANSSTNGSRFLSMSLPVMGGSLISALALAITLGPRIAMAAEPASSISMTAQTASTWWTAIAETGFYQAFSLVFLSEIGDKTFFIAGLLAMKTSRFISFLGSMAALGVMTIISVLIGQIFHAVPSGFLGNGGIPLDDVCACLAFAFFGFKTLKEALDMDEGESVMDEELAEAQQTVDESRTVKEVTRFGQLASIFGLVFAAEFGDRSFLSTIALSAAQNPFSVAVGGVAAHALATGIAVSSGSIVAKYVSEKVIGIVGGTLFLLFAVTTALGIF